jgi:hypothetical protein
MYNDPQILYLLKNINRQICCINGGDAPTTPTEITFAPSTSQDSFGRLRVSEPFTMFDSSHRFDDNDLWSTAVNGGTATFNANQGLVDLTVTRSADIITPNYVIRETNKVFSYQPGKSLLTLNTFVFNPAQAGLRQRVGYFRENGIIGGGVITQSNGFYLQLADKSFAGGTVNTLSFVKASTVTGTPVYTEVNQADWNGDKLDGTGPSGLTLDITKAQILWMDMEWLGVGSVRMGFVINGQFILCHTFHHANIITSTYITTASLPLRYDIITTSGAGGTATLKQICSTVISEGGYELRGKQQSIGRPITAPMTFAVAGTYYPVVGIRLKSTRLDAIVIATAISLIGLGNGKNYQWRVVNGNVAISGGSWVPAGGDSAVEYNITGTSATGGRVLASGYVNSSNQGSPSINILKEALFSNQLERDALSGVPYELVIEMAIDAVGGVLGAYASIDWEEISR